MHLSGEGRKTLNNPSISSLPILMCHLYTIYFLFTDWTSRSKSGKFTSVNMVAWPAEIEQKKLYIIIQPLIMFVSEMIMHTSGHVRSFNCL